VSFAELDYTLDDGIAVITFNRPQHLNALSTPLAREIVAALEAAGADEAVKGIVLTGAGRGFSAGVDLNEALSLTVADIEPWFRRVAACYRQILLVEKPVVAALNGIAAGGGYQMSLVSDWRIGHTGTRMSQPEINAGLPSIMGAYWMSLHLPWALNQELSYTGRIMEAEECRRVGLLNELVETAELLPRAKARAAFLAGKSPTAFRNTKARFRELAFAGYDAAYAAAVAGMQASYANGEPQAVMLRFLKDRERAGRA
jgi:enoyl-CoA hydratase/carnithine racemase